ncbi:MAG: hypothetical protein V3T05_12905 [Myxococcota bacterium]
MSVLVDTGVLFGAAVKQDARHARAAALLRMLEGEQTFSTDHVVIETWMLLCSRAGWADAMRFWIGLRDTPLRIETATLGDLERAQAIAQAWSDQELDIVDCTRPSRLKSQHA